MTTINLNQGRQIEEEKNFSYKTATSKGFLFSLSLPIITMLVFGGLKIYASLLEKQNEQMLTNIQNQTNGLGGLENLDKIIDMQTRLEKIKDNLQIKNNKISRLQMTDVLDQLGADVNSGTVISSYKYTDDGKILVTFETGNFNDAAQQILNFKSSDYFLNANLTGISRQEKAISCNVGMNVKQQ